MSQRIFCLALCALLLALSFSVQAQQAGKIPRIGFLDTSTASASVVRMEAFWQEMRKLGWIEGKNITIEFRWAEGREERYATLAAELVRLDLDLIACNSTPAALALQHVTRKIPIVFASVSDPVASGIVASLARPQANITGVSNFLPATTAKLLELLKTAVPSASRFIVIRDPANSGKMLEVQELQAGARKLDVRLEVVDVRDAKDIANALSPGKHQSGSALVVLNDGVTLSNRDRIVQLAAASKLPAIYQPREFVVAGGLMSYGLNFCDHYRRGAAYVDKILKGAKPADLPIELPTTFQLVINLKTAKALGVAIPATLLATADEVIE